jgi:hypothetical protein
MSTKSTIGAHKNFDEKVREFVGTQMHKKLEPLKITIRHIKKIRIKIKQKYGLLRSEVFKKIFLEICSKLISFLETLKSYSKAYIKTKISDIFAGKELKA